MWKDLTNLWSELNLPCQMEYVGDFNFVEDAIDRLPIHEDSKSVVTAFRNFHKTLKLKDGWRAANPNTRDYSFTQMARRFSRLRIDRIYVSDSCLYNCEQWDISNPPLATDHHIVSVKMTNMSMPHVGKGRWTMPMHLLNNGKTIKKIDDVIWHMSVDIQSAKTECSEAQNPQTVYVKGKKNKIKILHCYRERSIPIKKKPSWKCYKWNWIQYYKTTLSKMMTI